MGIMSPSLLDQFRSLKELGIPILPFNNITNSINKSNSPYITNFSLQKNEDGFQYDTNICMLVNYSHFDKNKTRKEDLSIKYYEGFCLIGLAETTLEYHYNTGSFIRFFKTLFLEKYTHNNYYPEPYLTICPELELEGVGKTQNDSFLDICKLFDIYYTEASEITNDIQDFMDLIETNINTINSWKQDFYRLFWDMRKNQIFPLVNYSHIITIRE